MTRAVDLLATLGAGPLRSRRPAYVDLLAPCNQACPAGEDVQDWLASARAGDYRQAWLRLTEANPLPAVCGRVCFHPCETSCNRAALDKPVAIHAIERYLGDAAADDGLTFTAGPSSGKRVLVIGAGPCGVSAAYHLARLGHAVEVRDAGSAPGGMLHFGIPAYRLPRDVLTAEIERVEAMGVSFLRNAIVTDVLAAKAEGAFDALLVAVGARLDRRIEIPSCDASRILSALPVLRGIEEGSTPQLGRKLVVYGAGDTAMDVARSARRLGVDEPLIIYHRDRAHMRAHAVEFDAAMAEGVKMRWLTQLTSVGEGEIMVEEVRLDEDGVPRPTGNLERLDADTVVLALGERPDTSFLRDVDEIELREDGSIVVDANLMTGRAGVFAGGDVTPGMRSVSIAIGHGRRAAGAIDRWLRGESAGEAVPERPAVSFDMLHLPIYADAIAQRERDLPLGRRIASFEETTLGLTQAQALYEAQRCLSCGNCYECDMCYASCPEQAIIKLGSGRGYRIDDARCTGCAVCFEACPTHAIEMIDEARCVR